MINKAMLLGRIGRINFHTMPGGDKVCNLSMVTSEKYTKDGERKEISIWHNVTLYSKLALIVESYVKERELIYIEGKMDTKKFTDKEGIERYKTFVVASELKLMPRPKAVAQDTQKPFSDELNDEIPF